VCGVSWKKVINKGNLGEGRKRGGGGEIALKGQGGQGITVRRKGKAKGRGAWA